MSSFERHKMWLALNVDHVEAEFLMYANTIEQLPVEYVKTSFNDLSKVAVVSWRRDGTRALPSRNLACAVLQAKKMHIRHLFIDVISIDQTLQGIYLIQQVMAFSVLYKIIPVIVAYDELEEDFELTTMRPWIFYEMRCFLYNRSRVFYVGWNNKGAKPVTQSPAGGRKIRKSFLNYEFGRHFVHARSTTFAPTIIGVLVGMIGMYSIADFRFLMPEFAQTLTLAYKQMSRNDYLLTAVILSKPSPDTPVHDSENIASLAYERYKFRSKPSAGDNTFNYTIIFGGAAVANWRICRDKGTGKSRFHLIVFPRAQPTIFAALGQEREPYVKYFGGENTQGLDSQMDHDMRKEQMPRLVVNSVCLHSYNHKKLRNVSERGETQQSRGGMVKVLAKSLCGLWHIIQRALHWEIPERK